MSTLVPSSHSAKSLLAIAARGLWRPSARCSGPCAPVRICKDRRALGKFEMVEDRQVKVATVKPKKPMA
jgi:hypothetical protein